MASKRETATNKPNQGTQVMQSPISTINTGTESCSGKREGVLVTVSREIFPTPVTK